jgi:hypothetical protein
MSAQIDRHFVEEFNQETFVAFQDKGGLIRNRCRRKTGVVGYLTKFPKVGVAPAAQGKTRGGKVPRMEIGRDRVDCQLFDRYGSDTIDSLDELKTNVAERAAVQDAIVYSLNRAEDDFGLNALASSTSPRNSLAGDDTWTSDAIPRQVLEEFGNAEMIEGGQMHALISWRSWNALLGLNSFVNSQFGGDTRLTSEGQLPKMYFGFSYVPFSRLPTHTSGSRLNIFYNSRVLGVAVGAEIKPQVDYLPDEDAYQLMAKTSQGAVLIETAGVTLRRHS